MIPIGQIALFVLVAVTFAFPGGLQAKVYTWQDEEGNVHFTDDLLNVPPSYRDEVSIKDLPEPSETVTPAPQPASPPPSGETASQALPAEESDPAKVYEECVKKVKEEEKKWTDQLTQDQQRLTELNMLIHRTVTSKSRNEYQRERVAVKERIEQTESMLRQDLPPMEQECETFRYWHVKE